MSRRGSRPQLVSTLLLLCTLLIPLTQVNRATAQSGAGPVDLPAIILTTEDLEDAGYEGYGVWSGTPYGLADDVAYLSGNQNLDEGDVEETLTDAGYLASYTHVHTLPADPDDPGGDPLRDLATTVYLFEDADGAEAAYDVITDESQTNSGADIDNAGLGIGDDSELTTITWEADPSLGVPSTQIELEILFDRVVLEVSTWNYDPETAGLPIFEADEMSNIEAAGERLAERAEDALDGNAPNLDALTVKLESDYEEFPFISYVLLNESPVRGVFETDDVYETRVENQADRANTNVIRREQILTPATDEIGSLRYYTGLLTFASEEDAETYMANTEDRLNENPNYTDVVVDEVNRLGDEALTAGLTLEADGDPWVLNELFVRVGDTVAVIWFQQDNAGADNPEVSFDTLIEIGEFQAECLEDGSCDEPAPMPDEIVELVDDLGSPALGPRD
jgi:hypothetical protein